MSALDYAVGRLLYDVLQVVGFLALCGLAYAGLNAAIWWVGRRERRR